MKNIKFKIILSLFTVGFLFVNCDDDDATGFSNLLVNDVSGTVTTSSANLVFDTTINVNEGDEDEFMYTVTLSKTQPVDIHVKVTQLEGTAVLGVDVEAVELVIPAYTLSATGKIKVLSDCDIETDENITIQIGGNTTANADIPAKLVKLNIQNLNSPVLDMYFNFDQALIYGDPAVETSLCELGYDIDFYVLDSNLNDVMIYDAATGNCVEHLPLDTSDLADGTYYIYYDIYDSVGIDSYFYGSENFAIPIKVDYSKCGSFDEKRFVQEANFQIQSSQGSGSDYVMTIEVQNGVTTIKNSTNDIIAMGRLSQPANKLKAKNAIALARAKRHGK